ncbi:MAG: Na/Pi symporter, partial [Flavobacteriales bacterium]|nr:Na/Pi symporter [Flavobacteriales bacterium]
IVLVNSGKMTLRQAMGVVLGANIGTTVSSQVIASDLGVFAPVILLGGLVVYWVMREKRRKNTGLVIFYFGLLFFGLHTMENAVEPLRDQPFFYELMKHNENPLKGSLVGALVTLVIQSSSATVGMAIVLTKKGLLSLAGGVAVMMGAELGTCADTLLATIRGSRQAIKTGLFHLTFNLLSIGLGLIMFQPFTRLVQWVSADAPAERGLANAHVLFNLCGVVVFVWAIPLFEKALNLILPEKNTALLTQEGKSG